MSEVLVVGPKDLRRGDQIVGIQKKGPHDRVSQRSKRVVKAAVGPHPAYKDSECIQLYRRSTDVAGYELTYWPGTDYTAGTLFHVHRW
jgi:hypothetical protein